ncbi:MAG: metal-dependent transcriptional regulator [Thermoplasmataceae archaeon]
MINKIELTKKERDTIIAIGDYGKQDFPLRLVELSDILNVKPPTALNLVKRLQDKGCMNDEKGMIILTETGKRTYSELLENHRVIETLMVSFGIDAEKACGISGNIDYLIDHNSVDKVFAGMGNPKNCPHGKQISQIH